MNHSDLRLTKAVTEHRYRTPERGVIDWRKAVSVGLGMVMGALAVLAVDPGEPVSSSPPLAAGPGPSDLPAAGAGDTAREQLGSTPTHIQHILQRQGRVWSQPVLE